MAEHDLESTLVGSLVLRGDAVYELPAGFTAKVLSNPVARKAFEAISLLAEEKRPIDFALVASEAGFTGPQLDWLREAVRDHATTLNVTGYAEKLLSLHRKAYLRGLLGKAQEALGGEAAAEEVVGRLMARLFDVDRGDRPEVVSLPEVSEAALRDTGRVQRCVPLGFPSLDEAVKVRPGNLVILAAQTGMGKSTLAANFAENVARNVGPVLFHSLEMDERELWAKVASRATRLLSETLLGEEPMNADARAKVMAFHAERRALPMYFNTGYHQLGSVIRITEKWHRKVGLKLVVVDYLQLVEADLGKGQTEENRIGTVSRTLKQLAQRLQVPVIAVAQLNREVDRRQSEHKRGDGEQYRPPKLSDLRGSGRIEQDANTVLFLHNPQVTSLDETARYFGPYRLTVAKQRLGRKAELDLRADLAFSTFTDIQGIQ